MQFATRLCESADPRLEWMYLVNETLEGEKCIVPLLREISKRPEVVGALRETIMGQIDEEAGHVMMYQKLVGPDRIMGSGFRRKLHGFVSSLETVTLKLFALQGMLEGIALGALQHRLKNIEGAPSNSTDKTALIDEQKHVGLSYGHFTQLARAEGWHTPAQFKSTAKEINSIFASSFNGLAIATVFQQSFGVNVNPAIIENSLAMKNFRAASVQAIVKNKNEFVTRYFAVKLNEQT
jgi:hypothetical protein